MQAAYTNELIPLDVKSRCFPGSQTTDIMKASAWVDPESEQLPMLGYLKVQAHLSGVPVSSMSAILADQLAMDLGLPYAQVRHGPQLNQGCMHGGRNHRWQICWICIKFRTTMSVVTVLFAVP
jgi:hypothetical protein